MGRLLIPLLLFLSFSSRATSNFDDDENLFENLNKTLPEIYRTKVEDLTLRELSAASGVHIPEEHREIAQYLLKFRDDRPMSTLMVALQKHNTYSPEEAEEFSRGALRALLDKSFMISPRKRLQPGDHLCRCNQRECASVHNELYTALGPDMASFCRVDKYGFCSKSTRVSGNNTIVDLFCSYSYATDEQKEMHEWEDHEHIHVCKSTKMQGRECCKGPMCNDLQLPITDPQEIAMNERWRELTESRDNWKAVSVSLTVVVIILLATLILILLLLCKIIDCEEVKKRLNAAASGKTANENMRNCPRYFNNESTERGSNAGSESPLIPPSIVTSDGGTTAGNTTNPTHSFHDLETTQGIGTGMGGPLVAQRTISSFIRLTQTLGQGKFGKVFLGEWRGGEKIAVKKFEFVLQDSFGQEVEILKSGMMSNSNILRWIGEDTVHTGTSIEFWIMSEYHPNGSLYDYLEKNALSQQTYLIMMRGIANGISFLHSEIPATARPGDKTGKKGVAHRDLKTKNILVKSDLTCVIADFGMAVINGDDGVKLPPGTKKSGTVRYLAPEVLTDDMSKVSAFEYYRASDMYSFALIMWECARRTHAVFGKTAICEYSMDESLAYYSDVPREPSVADMREAVVEKDLRPSIDEMWSKNPVFFEMSRIMRECWSTNSTARLTALNVKIVIDRLSSQLNLNLPTGYD